MNVSLQLTGTGRGNADLTVRWATGETTHIRTNREGLATFEVASSRFEAGGAKIFIGDHLLYNGWTGEFVTIPLRLYEDYSVRDD